MGHLRPLPCPPLATQFVLAAVADNAEKVNPQLDVPNQQRRALMLQL